MKRASIDIAPAGSPARSNGLRGKVSRTLVLRAILLSAVGLCGIGLSSAGIASSAMPKAEDDFKLVNVAEGVYAAIATPGGLGGGNAGFIIGDGGVLVVDTFYTPLAAQELIDAVAAHTSQPIRYVVNTHYHLDHTGGNQLFTERNIPVIAQENVRGWMTTKNRRFLPEPDQLQKRRDDAAKKLAETPADKTEDRAKLQATLKQMDALIAITLTSPTLTYDSGFLHLFLGKREVVLTTLPGHTGGDTLVYVPDANVVFTGDMGWSKTLPNLIDATVSDWVPSLDKVLSHHPNAKFVPGHGEVAGAAEIRDFRDYLDDLKNRVQKAIADGMTVEQMKKDLNLPEKYKNYAFQQFVQPNIEDTYKELKGTKQVK